MAVALQTILAAIYAVLAIWNIAQLKAGKRPFGALTYVGQVALIGALFAIHMVKFKVDGN